MFRGYIRKADSTSGCRGGIIGQEDGSYAIEIGANCYCEAEPAVVAGYYREILELLEISKSPLAKMLLYNIKLGIKDFEDQLSGQP